MERPRFLRVLAKAPRDAWAVMGKRVDERDTVALTNVAVDQQGLTELAQARVILLGARAVAT